MGTGQATRPVRGTTEAVARAALVRATLTLGWVPLLALIALVLLLPEIPVLYRYLPLLASALLFGLPHGAVDYTVLPRVKQGAAPSLGAVGISLLYCLLGGAYLFIWFVAPGAAAGGFLLLTWIHWGQGDVYVLRDLFAADYLGDFTQQSLTVVVRGGLPILVPLLRFPERYLTVVGTFVEPFGTFPGFQGSPDPAVRWALGAVFALVTIGTLVRGWRRTRHFRGWGFDLIETGLLWGYFLVVPPVLAVGLYFCLWHSTRHLIRVALTDGGAVEAIADRRWGAAAKKVGQEALLPSMLALGLIGALWWTVPEPVIRVPEIMGLYLVGIAVLTLPHTVVVTWLDYEQEILAGPSG